MSEAIVISTTAKFATLSTGAASKPIQKPSKSSNIKQNESSTNNPTQAIDIEQSILTTLLTKEMINDTWYFAIESNLDHQLVIGAMKSLLPDFYIKEELITTTYYTLTDEGKDILTNGSPEYQVYKYIPDQGITVNELNKALGKS